MWGGGGGQHGSTTLLNSSGNTAQPHCRTARGRGGGKEGTALLQRRSRSHVAEQEDTCYLYNIMVIIRMAYGLPYIYKSFVECTFYGATSKYGTLEVVANALTMD